MKNLVPLFFMTITIVKKCSARLWILFFVAGLTMVTGSALSSAHEIGEALGGGKVAYILQPEDPGYILGEEHGLIAAAADLLGNNGDYNWNDAIVACGKLKANGFSDWRLPKKDELQRLYLNKAALGGFVVNLYWSSTEYSAGNAWCQYFGDGDTYYDDVNDEWRVRPVRSF